MKKLILVLSFFCFNFANAQNTNVTINSDLSLTCKFEKVILKIKRYLYQDQQKELVLKQQKHSLRKVHSVF